MSGQGETDTFLADVAAEDPSFAEHIKQRNSERGPQPTLEAYQSFYLNAWRLLSDDRDFNGMGGVGAIPYTTISCYAADHGITGVEFFVFHRLIKALDAEYLTWTRETAPNK